MQRCVSVSQEFSARGRGRIGNTGDYVMITSRASKYVVWFCSFQR